MEMSSKICSRSQANRYLLNQMNEEEETLFQEHLMDCPECHAYISRIRATADEVSDGKRWQTSSFIGGGRKNKFLHTWLSVAAVFILMAGGTVVYFLLKDKQPDISTPQIVETNPPTDHPVLIDTPKMPEKQEEMVYGNDKQEAVTTEEPKNTDEVLIINNKVHTASGDYLHDEAIKLLFPDKTVVTVQPEEGKPLLVFKWNREVSFELTIKSDTKTLFEAKGTASNYTLDKERFSGHKQLDWNLILENDYYFGEIIIVE